MPEISLAGEVFTLDVAAGFDAGIVRSDVGAGSRMSFAARFELCHGLSAELAADVVAEAAADLGLLWVIAGRAEGQAIAAAGVQLEAQATIDLFDRVGMSAEAAAFAEAAVAGRLSIGLDLQDIALAARDMLPGPAYDVFIAMLREVTIGAGVWGKIAFAAMARAHLNIRGSLAEDRDAGFIIEHGAEAGLGAGMGYDFYAGIRLDNPKRFFANAADIITGAIVGEARPLLPRAFGPQLTALEYILPATLATAYELGQLAAQDALDEQAGDVLVDCCLAELQRFAFDKVGLAAATLVAGGLEDLASQIATIDLTNAQRQSIADACRSLIATLRGEALSFTAVQSAVPVLAGVLDDLSPATREQWRPLLAATWLAFAAAEAIRQGIRPAHAGASAGLIGLRAAAAEAFLVALPTTPDIVREELTPLLGIVPDRLELAAVVDYLVDTELLPFLEPLVPDLYALLELISRETGIGASELVEVALRASAGDDLTQSRLYQAFRAVAGSALDDLVLDSLLPELQSRFREGSDPRIWVDEVAYPSLTMMRDFALGRLDDLVAGRGTGADTLRTGLSLMIGKVVLANVVVLSDILLDHVKDSLSDAAAELSTAVREGSDDALVTAAATLLESFLPRALPRPTNLLEAARPLAAELLLALSEATSDAVLTDARRERDRALTRRILFSVYGEADVRGADALDDFLAQAAACAYMPAPAAVSDLVVAQTETLSAQLTVALPRVAAAVKEFLLTVTVGDVGAIDAAFRQWFADEQARIVKLGMDVVALGREITRLANEAGRFADRVSDRLEVVASILRRPARRAAILDALEVKGIAEARLRVHVAFGNSNDPPSPPEQLAVGAAINTFSGLFALARPLLDVGLQVLADVADQVSDLFAGAANLSQLVAALAEEITDQVEEAVDDLAGLQLPEELSVAVVAQTAAEVVTGLPLIGTALAAAIGFRTQEAAARAGHAAAGLEQAKTQALMDQARDSQTQAAARGPARITICSPQPLSDALDDTWAYGDAVPVEISVANLEPPQIAARNLPPAGIFLALNGVPLRLVAGAWKHGDGGLRTLSYTLKTTNSTLRPGVNVLECSHADGINPVVRASALFLAHAAPARDEATTLVDAGALTIRAGRVPVRIDGWRAYHSHDGQAPLAGTIRRTQRRSLSNLVFEPRPANGGPPGECERTVTLVDDRRRWRGEIRSSTRP